MPEYLANLCAIAQRWMLIISNQHWYGQWLGSDRKQAITRVIVANMFDAIWRHHGFTATVRTPNKQLLLSTFKEMRQINPF